MRFMMIVKADANYEAGLPPDPALMEAVGKLSQEAFEKGIMVDTGGLAPTSKGARVRVSRGKVTVTDGPFAEAKEIVGGYAIMELPSRESAVEHGRRFMELHRDILGPDYEGELEIRQLFTAADFAPAG